MLKLRWLSCVKMPSMEVRFPSALTDTWPSASAGEETGASRKMTFLYFKIYPVKKRWKVFHILRVLCC